MFEKTSILTVCLLSVLAPIAFSQADAGIGDPKTIQEVTRATPTVQDLALTEKIRNELQQDEQLQPALNEIQLKTVNGVVHLKGTVNSQDEKNAVEQKVRACSGVGQINSHILIAGR